MKKLIAISVMLALFTGIAFAQTSISGAIETRGRLYDGLLGDEDNKPTTMVELATAHIQLAGRNEAGTIGGLARIRQQDAAGAYHRAHVWWRPIPELRIFMGRDDDGMFSTGDALTDWQFHQGTENWVARHDWAFWRSVFPGNWDKPGIAISYYGIEGLTLNLVIPAEGSWELAEMYPFGLQFQGTYRIPDVGTILWSYVGSRKSMEAIDDPFEQAGFGRAGASFLLTAIPGIRVQIGASFDPALHGPDVPYRIGFGLHYNSGNFGLKTRGAVVMNYIGNDIGAAVADAPTFMTFNIMPHYTMGNVSIFCDIVYQQRSDQDYFSWWVTPYLRYASFRTGLWIEGDTRDETKIRLRFPIHAVYSF